MNVGEIFLESHSELVALVRWISKPLFLVKGGQIPNEALRNLAHGAIIITNPKADDPLRTVNDIFPSELAPKIIEAFLESHRKLSPPSTDLPTAAIK